MYFSLRYNPMRLHHFAPMNCFLFVPNVLPGENQPFEQHSLKIAQLLFFMTLNRLLYYLFMRTNVSYLSGPFNRLASLYRKIAPCMYGPHGVTSVRRKKVTNFPSGLVKGVFRPTKVSTGKQKCIAC